MPISQNAKTLAFAGGVFIIHRVPAGITVSGNKGALKTTGNAYAKLRLQGKYAGCQQVSRQ